MSAPNFTTADLIDLAPDTPACEIQFRNFGKARFSGKIRTLKCLHDNSLLRRTLNEKSDGEVLVVDGGGSLACALMGDMIAAEGWKNGWAGIVIYGAIRDSAAIGQMDFGVKALGTNPRRSAKNNEGETGIPLEFGGAVFVPGHYLYSDEDGILVSSVPLL